jgi:hypothetical protein
MGRTVAIVWHASFSVLAAGLYFVFVLPRWWEMTGQIPHAVGTALRILTAVVIGLAALPVVFTLLRTRKPEFGVPQLALTLRVGSIVAHVLAGLLIAGTAVSEIWLSLDTFGQWLFGVYGGAAAVAILAIAGFYLSFVAELPPRPPKPLKPKKQKGRWRNRKRGKAGEEAEAVDEELDDAAQAPTEDEEAEEVGKVPAETGDAAGENEEAEKAQVADDTADTAEEPEAGDDEPEAGEESPAGGKLRNRRPTGKARGTRGRRGPGGNVAVSD